jgi:hypothetical protein
MIAFFIWMVSAAMPDPKPNFRFSFAETLEAFRKDFGTSRDADLLSPVPPVMSPISPNRLVANGPVPVAGLPSKPVRLALASKWSIDQSNVASWLFSVTGRLASLMVASRNRRTGEHRLLIASPNPERFRQRVFQNFALGIKGLLGWWRNGDVSSLGKNRAKSLHWNGSRIRRFRSRSFVQLGSLSNNFGRLFVTPYTQEDRMARRKRHRESIRWISPRNWFNPNAPLHFGGG